MLLRTTLGVAAALLLVAGASTAAVASPTFTVQDAAAVIGVVPQHPTADVPFKPNGGGSTDLRRMIVNPGDCGNPASTPPKVCHRWAAGIREALFVGAPERLFRGRHGDVDDTAYLFRDEAGAKRAFPIVKEIWTLGFFQLHTFPVRGLGTQQTGLIGSVNLAQDDLGIAYLWRVGNVVFEVLWIRAKYPAASQLPRLEAALRPYANEVNRRAQSHL